MHDKGCDDSAQFSYLPSFVSRLDRERMMMVGHNQNITSKVLLLHGSVNRMSPTGSRYMYVMLYTLTGSPS